jgi:hypothetical protein
MIIAAIFSGKLFLVTDEKGVVIILMATEIEIVARYLSRTPLTVKLLLRQRP